VEKTVAEPPWKSLRDSHFPTAATTLSHSFSGDLVIPPPFSLLHLSPARGRQQHGWDLPPLNRVPKGRSHVMIRYKLVTIFDLKAEEETRMNLKKIFAFMISVIVVVAILLLPDLSSRWEDQLRRSEDPEAAQLFKDAGILYSSLHGEDLRLFNRETTRGVWQTITFNCFRFKNPMKCEPAKARMRSIIDYWNQRVKDQPAP
jgi:hypothetical protein